MPFDKKGGLLGFCEAFGEQYEEILEEMNIEIGDLRENLMNWKTLKLKDVCKEITSGGAAPQGDKYFTNGLYPFVRVADMGKLGDYSKNILKTKDLLNSYGTEKLREFPAGTVLFTKSGASLLLNQRAVLKFPMYVVSHIGCMIPNTNVISDWLYYYMKQVDFAHYAHATTLPSIKLTTLKEFEIPVPPLPEQERIVARIEELFSELDKAVETLKTTKQQIAVYRQAVLKEAFDIQAETVEILSIVKDIRIGPFGTALHKEDYINNGIPVINPQHIKNNSIIPSSKITVTQDKANELLSYQLKANDIIMGRRGEMGRAAAITEKESGWICGTGSIRFRLKDEFDAEFYAKILSSPSVVHYLEEKATGTTMKNLNEKIVSHIPVPKITRQTQVAITNRLENILSVCDSIEQTVNTVLQQAEAMRQSILKQAFEGGL